IAAAFLNQLAAAQNMNLRAIARGTQPDAEIAPNAARGLSADGLVPLETTPQKVSPADFVGVTRVVAFGKLALPATNAASIEQWDDVPPVSESYERARDVIVEHIRALLGEGE